MPIKVPRAGANQMFNFVNDAEKAHFFIQLKGNNAGRPLREKIPNSIGISVDERIFIPDYFYYLVLNLFNTGKFKPLLKGSVVPFIRQRDIVQAVLLSLVERSES